MKKLFVTFFIILSTFVCKSQNAVCVLIGDTIPVYNSDTSTVSFLTLYNKAKTNIIFTDDTINEPYFYTELLAKSQNRFLVNVFSSIDYITNLNKDSIWLCRENVGIGVIAKRLPNNTQLLPIYDKPDSNATYKMVNITNGIYIATVIDFFNNWEKIVFDFCGKDQTIGWISPENQCTNMYSMCMGN